jgi:predicted DNA-binding transcriptional regulator YafY
MKTDRRIKTFALIIDLLQRRKSITLQEIIDCLEANDISLSRRTVERYIKELRDEFDAITDCDRRTNRYSLNEEDPENLNRLLHVIHLVHSSELLMESMRNREQTLSCLSFESNGDYVGNVHFEPIYAAILQSKIISFDHENYTKKKISHRTIKPYLLKEYNGKWYVIGVFADSGEVRTFGLDRISKLTVSDETFKKTEQKRISNLFNHLIGLVYDIEKPTTVRLSVTPSLSKYFKNTPLHASQELESESDKEVVFTYYLIPNLELQRLILGYASQMKVLHPQSFADKIKEEIRKMSAQYENTP